MNSIIVNDVSKQFGNKVVLDHVSMYLEAGKIHGLIGDNGSGKSILLKCICGIIPFDSGSIIVEEAKIKPGMSKPPHLGLVIEHPGFLNSMTGWRNLKYLAGIRGIAGDKQILQALESVNLTAAAKKKVKKYSLGMRQRLAIAQAIMEDPPVYIMDEPFNGLDKSAVASMHDLFLSLKAKGCTLLLVSHHAADIDLLCDDVYEIESGHLKKMR